MITRFVIGILVFTVRLVHFALKAAWGIPKGGVLFAIGIPAFLIVLFAAGMVFLAVPLLISSLFWCCWHLPLLIGGHYVHASQETIAASIKRTHTHTKMAYMQPTHACKI